MKFPLKLVACLVLGAIFTVGCSGQTEGKPRQKVYKAKGKATFLGGPLIGATVAFSPLGKQPVAIGRTNDVGEFNLTTYSSGDGAAAGDYKVTLILVDTSSDKKSPTAAHAPNQAAYVPTDSDSQDESSTGKTMLPDIYTDPAKSPLKATVEANKENNFTFDLKQ